MQSNEKGRTVDLRAIFVGLQDRMIASLSANRRAIQHPVAKGDAAELQWLNMLNDHLPKRYCADRAFILDCEGGISDCIDVVIYDRQYSPFLFNRDNVRYLPAEAVYGVFEVKQELNAAHVAYAGEKAATVRALQRTSAPIRHAGGKFEPIEPPPIIAGVLTLGSEWNPPFGDAFNSAVKNLSLNARLELGCALQCGGFEVGYAEEKDPKVVISKAEAALIFFFFKLLTRLQRSGTVAAIDLERYGLAL